MARKQTTSAAPFVFGRVAEGDCFADRDAERARLGANIASLTNTIIVSPRRWGKSSLVGRVSQDISATKSDIRLCQIDLFNVRTEADFYAQMATAVLAATLTKWDEWLDAVQRFMSHLRPSVSINAGHEISLELDWHAAEQNPDDVLDLAEKIAADRDLRLAVCFDEFQAIAGFAEPVAFQRKLRAHWQRHQHVCYCLYGSKRHMLLDIFANPEQPFYRFGDIITLAKIDNAVWGDFIAERFAATGKTITPELGRTLAAAVDNHPYYVQQLAQQAWLRTTIACRPEIVDAALADLTDQLSLLFTGLAESLTRRQLNFLHAALDGQPALSSQAVLKAYDLGTSANVARIKEALVNREIIDVEDGQPQILDPIFAHWLRTAYFIAR